MEQLIELFEQIKELASAGADALKGAAKDTGEGGAPPKEEPPAEGAPPEGAPPPEEK